MNYCQGCITKVIPTHQVYCDRCYAEHQALNTPPKRDHTIHLLVCMYIVIMVTLYFLIGPGSV